MPRNPNRLRHGMGHSRLPSQAQVAGEVSPRRTPTGIVKQPAPSPFGEGIDPRMMGMRGRRQSIPVHVIDAFFQMLPTPGIQQQAISSETRFNFFSVETVDGLTIGEIPTRDQQVYIWTDLTFYALIPGEGMASPPSQLDMHQLSGLLKFTLEIDNIDPMNLVSNPESPYDDPRWPAQGLQSGWGTLDRDFGATRFGTAFALYARSGQRTRISMKAVQTNRPPRFALDRIGYEIHGYVASEADFDEVWRKTVGG
jgi:hypothetical protein